MKTHSHYTFSPLSMTIPGGNFVVLECRLAFDADAGRDRLTYQEYPVLGWVSRTGHQYTKEFAEQSPVVLGGVDHGSLTQVGYCYQSSADLVSAVVLHPTDGPLLAEQLFSNDPRRALRYVTQEGDWDDVLEEAEKAIRLQVEATSSVHLVCHGASSLPN